MEKEKEIKLYFFSSVFIYFLIFLTQIGFIESFCRLFSVVFLSVLENILHFYKLAVHIRDNVTDIFA